MVNVKLKKSSYLMQKSKKLDKTDIMKCLARN